MRHRLIPAIVAVAAFGGLATNTVEARGNHRSDCVQRGATRTLTVVGLTRDQQVVCFREDRPGRIRSSAPVVGLAGDTRLVGIDHRPATGDLFGAGDAGGIYVIDAATGQATKVAQMDVALSGTSFGADFNPTVDRLRLVSDNGQNLRVNVDTGATTVDAGLNTGAAAPVVGVTSAAYTNNDADPATATTLFDIDTTADRVAIQAPPNAGTLNPTGNLGVDATGDAGFDIYSATTRDGSAVNVRALASLTVGGSSSLYEVDLLTGRASWRGALGADVVDIAFPL
jgi:hypothetical protein